MLEKIGLFQKPSLREYNWVVDGTHCQGCSSQFTFIYRKHHCRRCGGLFCNSCTQQRMVLRGHGDSPVRICEPCKKLEEAAYFEMRLGHKNRTGRGGSKLTSKYEDGVLNKILGNEGNESVSSGQESTINMLSSIECAASSASSSYIQEITSQNDGGEILSLSVDDVHNNVLTQMESVTPEELRQQALDEKKKYKLLKAEGKSEEALRSFKRGKELERRAGALEIHLRRSRKRDLSSINTNEIPKPKDDLRDSDRKIEHAPQMSKEKDDLAGELRELGWSDVDLRVADKKLGSVSLDGELSTLLGEVSQNTNTEKGTHGIDKSQVIAHKKKALALKREGKLTEAKEELKRAKVLEKQIEEQEFLVDTEDSDEEIPSSICGVDIAKHPNFSFDHLVGIADGLGVDNNFEVTDEDMDDPEITAALKLLGWTEDINQPDDFEPQFVPVDREALLIKIQSLKREALIQKRVGNTAEAMALLKKAKVFEGDLDSSDSQGTNLMSHDSAMVQKRSISHSTENSLKPNPVDVRNANERKDTDPKSTPKMKLMIQKELLGLKKMALSLRREGRLDEAYEELKKGKALEQQLEEMDNASKVKVTRANVSNKLVDSSAVQDVGDDEEDVTDQDMHDPLYLSLLRNLGWKDEDNEAKQNDSTSLQTIESSIAQVHTGIQVGASRRSKSEIQRELLGLKRKSLALRRQGEAEEAEEVLKMARLLEAQLADMEAPKQELPVEFNKHKNKVINTSLKNAGDAGILLEDIPLGFEKNTIEGVGSEEEVIHAKREEIVRASEKQYTDESDSTQVMISQSNQSSLQQEIMSHKRKAITLKREGKLAEAKEELRQAKLLEESLEDNNPQPGASSSAVPSSSNASAGQKEHSLSLARKLSSRDRFKLQQESLSHKRQSLKLRREGRMEEAEAEFVLAKALETQLDELPPQDSMKSPVNATELVDDVSVDDLLYPQLLSALKAIGLEDAGIVSQGPERLESSKSVANKMEDTSEKRNQLEEWIKAEKVKAVNLKRSGKQAEALDALRRAKLLEKELNSLASL